MTRKRQVKQATLTPILDPRQGDIEDDASSTKRRSMLSLFGSLLVEISLPKLILAWILLLVVPGLLLGLAPLILTEWLGIVANKIASAFVGIGSAILLLAVLALGWFGWRTLFRMIEKNFWALNSIVVAARLRGRPRDLAPFRREIIRQDRERGGPRQVARGLGGDSGHRRLWHRGRRAVARLAGSPSLRSHLGGEQLAGPRSRWRSPTASSWSRAISRWPRSSGASPMPPWPSRAA